MKPMPDNSWRRCRNPEPKHWPGPWIVWRHSKDFQGCCQGAMLEHYFPGNGLRIQAELQAGKRKGTLMA